MRVKGIGLLPITIALCSMFSAPEATAGAVGAAKPGDQYARILADYLPFLKEYGLVPIQVPQGQRVGDVFDGQGWRLLATADDCFPGLPVRHAPTALPSISGRGTKALTAALGLTVAVDAGVELGEDRSYEMSFTDAVATSASLVQLRDKLRSGVPECESVRPFLNAANSDREVAPPNDSPTDPPLLIGTLIEARRIVRVSARDIGQASAEVSIFSKWLKRVGLGAAEVKVAAKDNGEAAIEIAGVERMAVAFRPVYIVRDMAHASITYRVTEFDPGRPGDTERLESLLLGAFTSGTP